ncbi:MAG: MarR family transcriptional regulator, partial [Planctomycetaceae bacterium]|nr:MarR family transcriptional regulator [Planctomycetaceae bacterium]
MQYDFEASVGYWVTILALSFRRCLNEELAPHGITFRQSQVLGWLVLEGELSQVDLASRMEVEAPTLTGLIDRMEAAGLVTRTCCESDRRKKMIRPTKGAEPIWEQIASCARDVRQEATAGLSPNQVEELLSLLKVVHDNLSQRHLATVEGR